MVSFADLWEQVDRRKSSPSPLMGSGEDGASITVIKTGKEFHKEKQTPFWDEFITLCSNTDGLSQLLNVSPEKIRSWPARIREALNKLEKHIAEDPSHKEKTELIPTGDNGAFTINQDPNIGSIR